MHNIQINKWLHASPNLFCGDVDSYRLQAFNIPTLLTAKGRPIYRVPPGGFVGIGKTVCEGFRRCL